LISGNDVNPEQPFHVLANDVTPAVSNAALMLVKFEAPLNE